MPTSMTGFGRAEHEASFGSLIVELQSINRKFLEIFITMPKELSRFESQVRSWINEEVSRGQITARLFLTLNESVLSTNLPSAKTIKEFKKGWEKLAAETGLDAKDITLPFIVKHLPQTSRLDLIGEEGLGDLKKCLKEALKKLIEMRGKEGSALCKDLAERLKIVAKLLDQVVVHAPDATNKMRLKLEEKLKEIKIDSEERLLKEVAVFAEKVDIAEEITRLRSHITQFGELLKQDAMGRKMDFLMQEMVREVNTIGSKSMEVAIARLVIEMKSELEKMREQIQNLE